MVVFLEGAGYADAEAPGQQHNRQSGDQPDDQRQQHQHDPQRIVIDGVGEHAEHRNGRKPIGFG